MWIFGPPDVEKMVTRKNVKGLARALNYPKDSEVRASAATALGEIGDPRAAEPLVASLLDKDGDVRSAAADALVRIGAPALEPLVTALGAEEARDAAAGVIIRMGEPAVSRLLSVLTNPYSSYDTVQKQQCRRCLIQIGDPAVQMLIEELKRGEDVASVLVQIGSPRAVKALMSLFRGGDVRLRDLNFVVGALGSSDRHLVEPLIGVLNDESAADGVRGSAAEALAKIGDLRSVGHLTAALEADTPYWVRHKSVKALGQIGDPRAVEPLVVVMDQGIPDAARALGQIGDPRAMRPLIGALRDTYMCQDAAEALGRIGDSRAVEPLIAALKDDEPRNRRAAADALGNLGDVRAVEPLIDALGDAKKGVRERAAEGLARMYREGLLDEPLKKCLLSKRSVIQSPHKDGPYGKHHDEGTRGCFSHDDFRYHVDQGIGVDFPL